MAYDRAETFEKALALAENDTTNHFFQDIWASLGMSNSTFFRIFPVGSNEYKAIDNQLTQNKVSLKKKMRAKWSEHDHPALQMGLYKLIGTDEERNNLTQQRVEVKADVNHTRTLDVSALSTTTLLELKRKFYDKLEAEEVEEVNE